MSKSDDQNISRKDNSRPEYQYEPIAGFEKLWVWQKAHKLMLEMTEIIKRLPVSERFKLASQIDRATSSVPDNIAEGHTSYYYQDKIKGFKEKAVEKTQEQIEKTVGEKGSLRGTLEGLLFNTLSFTWNLPERLVRKVVDTATNDSKQTGVVLKAIRQGDEVVNGRKVSGDAIVSRKLASNITDAVQEYKKNQTKIQDERRKLLQMDKITEGVQDFRNGLQNLIKNDFQFKENMLGQVIPEFRPFFGETGQKGVVNALESLYDPRFNDGFITLEQLDKFKQLVGDLRYGKDGPTTNATRVLDKIYAYTRDYIGKVADDAITMNAQVTGLRKQKVKEGLQRDVEAGYKDPQIRKDS